MRYPLPLLLPLLILPCSPAALRAQTTQVVATARLSGSVLVYDEARRRLVLLRQDGLLLESDGSHWATTTRPPTAPLRAVYDPASARVMLAANFVWQAYDGHATTNLGSTPFQPAATRLCADPGRGRVVAFTNDTNLRTLAHEWDGTTWLPPVATPTSAVPMAAAYDPVRQQLLVATVALSPSERELWQWDGSTWTSLFRSGTTPVTTAMAFDPQRQLVIQAQPSVGTFGWNGTSWQLLSNQAPPVPVSLTTSLAERCVFAMPANPTQLVDDPLWRWDGSQWQSLDLLRHERVSNAQWVFDTARGTALLIGGTGATGQLQERLSRWDGRRWTSQPTPVGVPLRFGAAVFDAARGETVLFGGLAGTTNSTSTWAFDGTTWRVAATAGPAARNRPAMAYVADRQRVMLLGGQLPGSSTALTDHWEFDGINWVQVAAATPVGGALGALGYDAARRRAVFVSNATTLPGQPTYEYDGAAWTQVATSAPIPVDNREMVWVASRQRLRLAGSDPNALPTTRGTWEYDGVAWTQVDITGYAEVYDPARDLLLAHDAFALRLTGPANAAAADYGSPCGGGRTTTSLTAFGRPVLGTPGFHLDVRADAAQRPAVLGFGLAQANAPLGNGCTLLVQQPLGSVVWFTDAQGFLHYPWPLPASAALRGVPLVAQAAVLDPASPGGLALSQGLQLRFGD